MPVEIDGGGGMFRVQRWIDWLQQHRQVVASQHKVDNVPDAMCGEIDALNETL